MLAKPFDHTHAKCLLKATRTSKYWKIDVQGVWPKKSESEPDFESDFEPDAESQVGPGIDKEFDNWVPVNVFARDENAPDCANTPALSFPFDARDLAAFMLYGNGCLIAEYYGGWQNGPDSERLDALLQDNFSRRAVEEAFEAYREAQKIVGPYPLELDDKAERARKAWNDADSETDKETKAALDLKMEATAAEAKAAQGKWLGAMVRVLLQSAPAKSTTTAAPPVVASDCSALSVFGHSTKTRRNVLTPVIEQAQRECKDRTDTAEVWATLQVLAEKKTPPLIGATEDGLQYLKNGNAAIFTRDALKKRLAR